MAWSVLGLVREIGRCSILYVIDTTRTHIRVVDDMEVALLSQRPAIPLFIAV